MFWNLKKQVLHISLYFCVVPLYILCELIKTIILLHEVKSKLFFFFAKVLLLNIWYIKLHC